MKIKFHLATYSLLFLVAFIVVLQAFSPKIEHKPAGNELSDVPQEVAMILKRSCFNCHSNMQNLTIWDQIAPISFLVSKDINRAREVLNFSNWGDFSAAEKKGKFFAMYNMVQAKKMPLPSYTLFHSDASLTSREINSIKQYAIQLAHQDSVIPIQDIPLPIGLTNAAVTPKEKPISPNGIAYDDAFKQWTVIGMSTLIDNSIRVIYANDIAVQAIAKEDFHPWPDGSMIAKAVWKQTKSQNGDIVPGEFVNVQYMKKKSREYTDTEGWGFAKFNGQNLKPTGNSVVFAQQSCISCHRQLAESTGYLFNVPPKVNAKKRIALLKP